MAWYSAGTVTVTNGSTVVTGAGTDFVSNVTARDGLMVAGGVPLEITSIQSATSLTLASPWLGATASGQTFKVLPTVGIYVDLALRALNMLTPFQTVLDGVGQGIFAGGTAGVPGVRFAGDLDTGVYRSGENQIGIIVGGLNGLNVRQGAIAIPGNIEMSASEFPIIAMSRINGSSWYMGGYQAGSNSWNLRLNGLAPHLTVTDAGLLLVGAANSTSYGGGHRITRGVAEGQNVLSIDSAQPTYSGGFFAVTGAGYNEAKTALLLGKNSTTGRSLSAGGTISASGADYAEYIRKAPNCGAISKGDVCGINRDGELVRAWADAVRFVVKSTDPNLVGGDTWAAHLPPEPIGPGDAPPEPVAPSPSSLTSMPTEPVREDGEEDIDFIRRMATFLVAASAVAASETVDREALAAYQAQSGAYPLDKASHDAALAAYQADLAKWQKDMETARQTVDRIAFSGQVPVNVDDATLTDCEAALADGVAVYLVAVARGAGIGVSAVRESDMTLPLYMRRLGAVWSIRDGRPWVDVQHG